MIRRLCRISKQSSCRLQTIVIGHNQFRRACVLGCFLVLAIGFQPAGGFPQLTAQVPQPGAAEMVALQSPAGDEVKLDFRYCPTGEISPKIPMPKKLPDLKGITNPLLRKMKLRGLKADVFHFYMLETEVTQGLYSSVMGAEKMALVRGRMEKFASDEEYFPEYGSDYPVCKVTLQETVEFCAQLDLLYQQSGKGALITQTFAIPTTNQWQYAARAVTTLEEAIKQRHFPGLEFPEDEVFLEKCVELWDKLNQTGPFEPDQEHFGQMMSAAHGAESGQTKMLAVELFGQLMAASYKTVVIIDENAEGAPSVPYFKVRSSKPNAWGIYEMLFNISEWTIKPEGSPLAGEFDVAVYEEASYYVSGGNVMRSLIGKEPLSWFFFSIWGGQPWELGELEATMPESDAGRRDLTYEEACDQNSNEFNDFFAGFRVVMKHRMQDGWFLALRAEQISEEDVAVEEKKTNLETIEKNMHAKLESPSRVYPLAVLQSYKAMNAWERSDFEAAAKTIGGAGGDDLFNEGLVALINNDGKE
jgi:hypothetical protein